MTASRDAMSPSSRKTILLFSREARVVFFVSITLRVLIGPVQSYGQAGPETKISHV